MEVSYKNTFWDYLQFNLYSILQSKVSLIILGILLFPLGWIMFDVARERDLSSFVELAAFSIMAVLLLGIVLLFLMLVMLIGVFLTYIGRNKELSEGKLQVTESGLMTEASVGRSEIQWSGIKAIKQSKRLIFIFFSAYMAYIVPKRAFAQKVDADSFFAYINELWMKHKHESGIEKSA